MEKTFWIAKWPGRENFMHHANEVNLIMA